jgi:hypothetical protein
VRFAATTLRRDALGRDKPVAATANGTWREIFFCSCGRLDLV